MLRCMQRAVDTNDAGTIVAVEVIYGIGYVYAASAFFRATTHEALSFNKREPHGSFDSLHEMALRATESLLILVAALLLLLCESALSHESFYFGIASAK
jgi:hypothetical protein